MKRTEIPHRSKLETELRSTERTLKNERIARKTMIRHAEFFLELEQMSNRVFYTTGDTVRAYAFLKVPAFTSADCPELSNILEWLDGTLELDEVRDLPGESEREYTFIGDKFRVIFTAELLEEGTCKRVIVGTKKIYKSLPVEVEEPVYAFEC